MPLSWNTGGRDPALSLLRSTRTQSYSGQWSYTWKWSINGRPLSGLTNEVSWDTELIKPLELYLENYLEVSGLSVGTCGEKLLGLC